MKKRLLKAMPHIPILELRPELREQNEASDDPDDPQDAVDDAEGNTMDDVDLNAEGTDGANTVNTTFHNLEAEHAGGNNGLVQRFKRFISKKKVNSENIAAGGTGIARAEDDTMRYGDDESSESDNETGQHDGIPLVRRSKRN